MTNSDSDFTVVFRNLTPPERQDLVYHDKFVAGSTSHAIQDREKLLSTLKFAEAALADIGDAEREPGDDLAWCENRAAEALPQIRQVLATQLGTQP